MRSVHTGNVFSCVHTGNGWGVHTGNVSGVHTVNGLRCTHRKWFEVYIQEMVIHV